MFSSRTLPGNSNRSDEKQLEGILVCHSCATNVLRAQSAVSRTFALRIGLRIINAATCTVLALLHLLEKSDVGSYQLAVLAVLGATLDNDDVVVFRDYSASMGCKHSGQRLRVRKGQLSVQAARPNNFSSRSDMRNIASTPVPPVRRTL